MPVKVSEKKLLFSIVLLAGSLLLFFTVNLTNAPVKISESGLMVYATALVLFIFAIRLFSRAIHKV